jgi:hypothetical protein
MPQDEPSSHEVAEVAKKLPVGQDCAPLEAMTLARRRTSAAGVRHTPLSPAVFCLPLLSSTAGLVTSLARPGGNLTGITLDAGIEIWGKRLQMLKEAISSTAKAAFLGMRDGWERFFWASVAGGQRSIGNLAGFYAPAAGDSLGDRNDASFIALLSGAAAWRVFRCPS